MKKQTTKKRGVPKDPHPTPPPPPKVSVKGFKVFNPDFTCNGMQYKANTEFKHAGKIKICSTGLHFCLKAQDCFRYYSFDPKNIICEVEAIGEIMYHNDDSKACTDLLIVGRQLTWAEVLVVANSGSNNTGNSNSGNSNSGDSNSGNWNSGNWNSGDRNSGDSNSGYRNSGAFCTDNDPLICLFDKPSPLTVRQWEKHKAVELMGQLDPTIWVPGGSMTKQEKESNPKWETTEGYLKTISMKEAWANFWHNLSDKNKAVFTTLPNFDAALFEEITGIKI